jgi:hypothetical protein
MIEKHCVKCGSTERGNDGRCAACNRKASAEWCKANAAARSKRRRETYLVNAEREKARVRAWNAKNPSYNPAKCANRRVEIDEFFQDDPRSKGDES